MQPSALSLPLQPPALPLTFRQELVPHVFHAVQGGWSCALVGLPGVGVSNLLRFLCEPRVVASYLGAGAASTLLVYVEASLLWRANRILQALAHAVAASAKAFGWPKAEVRALRTLAASAQDTGADDGLASILDYLCGPSGKGRRVVFVFDDFDQTFVRLPGAELRHLRALRDSYKYYLAYLVGARTELGRLAPPPPADQVDMSKFAELFDEHTFPVRPYRLADAASLLARKTFNWAQRLTDDQADRLYRATGGHAKLLVTGLMYVADRLHVPWANIERGLSAEHNLAEICREVWESLDTEEQTSLRLLAQERRSEIGADGLARLKLRGLAAGGPEFVFSSVFEAFVGAQPAPVVPSMPPQDSGARRSASRLRDPEPRIYW